MFHGDRDLIELARSPTRPLLVWKARTASSVSSPNTPSTLMEPRACCRSATCLPSLPELSRIECSVVVGGSGVGAAGLAVVLPLAMLAVGPTVSATSAPSETRFARELAGTNRSSAARRRARERPNESSQGCSSARSRAACRLRASSSAESEEGETCSATGRSEIGRVRARPRLSENRPIHSTNRQADRRPAAPESAARSSSKHTIPPKKETRWALKTDGICGEHHRRHDHDRRQGHHRRHDDQCGQRRNRCRVVELELAPEC